MHKDYDLLIIGGGSAGLTAARFARQLGLSVAIAEKGTLGGDCTWTGCVPSKSLIRAANLSHSFRGSERFGIRASSVETDFKSVMARVKEVSKRVFQEESPEVLQAEGIGVIAGEARFTWPGTVSIDGKPITARRFLVCTGARPTVPPIQGLDDVDYLTYETVWSLPGLPSRLAVIGGGPIGCELAQAFCRLGSSVTLIEGANRIMLQDEPEAADLVTQRLSDEGVELKIGTAVERVEKMPDGVRLLLAGGEQVEAGRVLLSVGRRPSVDGLGLAEVGFVHSPDGIRVNKNLRANRKNIYAAGDCAGGYQFTHYAGYQGFMAVRNAFLPFNKRAVMERVPWVTFTEPEVAHVGLTESQAVQRYGTKAATATWPLEQTDRWLTEGDSPGLLKIVHLPNGKLLGVTIVAARAGEMVQEWVLALDQGLKLPHIAHSMHAYPTYSMAAQQVASKLVVDRLLGGAMGKLLRKWARRMG